jgi:hypothetical protein
MNNNIQSFIDAFQGKERKSEIVVMIAITGEMEQVQEI